LPKQQTIIRSKNRQQLLAAVVVGRELKTMQISDILQEKGTGAVTISAGRNIHEAIETLNEHRIGALVVLGVDEEVVGIITERDILRKCGELCGNMNKTVTSANATCSSLVKDAMTTDLVIGVPEDDPNYAMGVMTKNHIRHLPILDGRSLAGMISIGDLVNAHLAERVFQSRTLKEYLKQKDKPKSL
jgi:CBS domain-containing protein